VIYKITEIFFSIQGEGLHTGMPAIFIRFSGCNMACEFCDTDHSTNEHFNENEILKLLQESYPKQRRVILTGGEPLLQELDLLVNILQDHFYWVAIETNGTILTKIPFHWITISPKGETKLFKGNELKVLYHGQDLVKYFNSFDVQYRFLQPIERDGQMNIEETIKAVKENIGDWRLSVQLHKLLGVR